MNEDIVDIVVREAQQTWPGQDALSIEAVLRILRLGHFMDQELTADLARSDLTPGDFGVLIQLRTSEPPYRLTPTQLYSRLLITSGGMTGRIDRLERRGLVCRTPDPNDRRSVLVGLTEEGQALIDEVAPAHLAIEKHLMESLTLQEHECLVGLLKKLLQDIESHGCCNGQGS